uniref:Uncharacterized protein n=1 Tax=Oryza punctata TaxID=4537 RepID=A0A0E0JWW7_ORYPU
MADSQNVTGDGSRLAEVDGTSNNWKENTPLKIWPGGELSSCEKMTKSKNTVQVMTKSKNTVQVYRPALVPREAEQGARDSWNELLAAHVVNPELVGIAGREEISTKLGAVSIADVTPRSNLGDKRS